MIRVLACVALVVLLTGCLYAAFYGAALLNHRLQLVIFEPSMDPLVAHHGKPTVALAGLLLYTGLCLAYAVAARAAMAGSVAKGRTWVVPVGLLFALSCAYVAIVHPYFLVTALPEPLARGYAELVRQYVPSLEVIYTHPTEAQLSGIILIHAAISVVALLLWRSVPRPMLWKAA